MVIPLLPYQWNDTVNMNISVFIDFRGFMEMGNFDWLKLVFQV